MFDLSSIQHIQQFIALLIAYVPTVTISGFLEAWAITAAGDDTPEERGFLTLNPMRHIDFIGILFLYLINWGFGQRVPFNAANITSPHRNLKFIGIVFTRPLVNLALIVLSVFALVMFKTGEPSSVLSDPSAFKMALNFVVASFLHLNLTFFVIYSILGLATVLVEFLLPDAYNRSLGVSLIVGVVFPMILFLALQPYIQYVLLILLRTISNLF